MGDKMKVLKGVIVLYVNFLKENDSRDQDETMAKIRDINKGWIDRIDQDGEYAMMLIPTVGEASRVEKIDYDAPFPRFVPRSMKRVLDKDAEDQE